MSRKMFQQLINKNPNPMIDLHSDFVKNKVTGRFETKRKKRGFPTNVLNSSIP